MTVLEFLAAYAALFLTRAQSERIEGIKVMYNEHEEGGYGYAYIHNMFGGVHLTVGFPLLSELKDAYTPVLTDEQWAYFKENITAPEPALVRCSGSHCDNRGEPNYRSTGRKEAEEFYCYGSDRCCP